MDRTTYERTTEKDFIGRKVKNLTTLTSQLGKFPAGMIWTIERKSRGFELISDPCPHCGIRACITKVPPSAVELEGELNIDLEGHMIPAELIELVNQEIHRGIEKWGHVDKTPQDFMIAIIEELGEAAHAINHGKSVETVRQELAEVIALLVRLWDKVLDV